MFRKPHIFCEKSVSSSLLPVVRMFLNQGNILQSLREYPDRHILVFPRNIATFFRSLSKKKRGSDSPFRRRTAGPPRYKDRWDAYEPANALEIEAAYQASQSFSLFRCLLATADCSRAQLSCQIRFPELFWKLLQNTSHLSGISCNSSNNRSRGYYD